MVMTWKWHVNDVRNGGSPDGQIGQMHVVVE